MMRDTLTLSGDLILYSCRLDGTSSPLDADCLVPAEHAARMLLARFCGMPGNRLPGRIRSHIAASVHKAAYDIRVGKIDCLEVLSLYHAQLSLRGLATISPQKAPAHYINVSHGGYVSYDTSAIASLSSRIRINRALQTVQGVMPHG